MNLKKIVAASAVSGVLLIGLTGCFSLQEYGGSEDEPTTDCYVDGKEFATDSEGAGVYRVFTSCGVFKVEDDPLKGVWNSADTYGTIQQGKTYDFEAYGIRNGFLSEFPNIIRATEVPAA